MDEATIKSMAAELAKGLKTPEDLNQMTAVFKKFMIETALNTELSEHLGYEKHQPKKGSNARNGFSSKTVLTQDGQHHGRSRAPHPLAPPLEPQRSVPVPRDRPADGPRPGRRGRAFHPHRIPRFPL